MNIAEYLTRSASRHRDRTAIAWGDERLTYGDLDARVSRFAAGLDTLGLRQGDRVALFMRNAPECVIAMFGAWRAGLVVVPVNAKLSARELGFVLDDCEAGVVVFDAASAQTVGDAVDRSATSPALLGAGLGAGGRGVAFEDFGAGSGPREGNAAAAPDDVAWIFYTSGTTGRPKGAMLSHRNLTAMTMSTLADVCHFHEDDVVLHAAPLSHGSGLYLLPAVAKGAANVIYHRTSFDAEDVLRVIEAERVTVFAFLAPTMIVLLLRAPAVADTSSLRAVIYGGGPLHLRDARDMLKRFGQVFVQIYGLGECPMTITSLAAEEHVDGDAQALVSAGFARTNTEVRVVDADGTPVPSGTLGEVVVRSDAVMRGYWKDEAATADTIRAGWLHTGDVGVMDASRRLRLLDRRADTIISGGTNIYPREVEDVLILHPALREAVVFGVPDELWGERVVAAVVAATEPAPTINELSEFCKTHLASFKKPSEVYFMSELPKNGNGKILRREVRASFVDANVADAGAGQP